MFINQVTNTAAQAFDFIGMMSYDAYGTWTGPGQHSSYDLAVDDFNRWRAKGVEAEKLIVGLPFYGYGWGNSPRSLTYNQIVNTYSGAENLDYINTGGDQIYYNGIPTIQQKTTFAIENAGGVMIWELTQDAGGDKSLLSAIGEVIGEKNPNQVPFNLATNKAVFVSSTEDMLLTPPSNVTDGLYSTRWSSEYTDDQWFYVDLEDEFRVNRIQITWEAASAKDYIIQFCTDAQNWESITTVTGNNDLVNDIANLNVTGRYIRVLCTSRNTEFGYSVYELEVYGQELPKPFSGTPISIPGIVEAENYDLGGEGVAYHDLDLGNTHGAFRNDDVDIEICTDENGGFNIGGIQAGEWLSYSIEVESTDSYDFNIRVASTTVNKTFHIEIDDVDVTGAIEIPNTGGWQSWVSVSVNSVYLVAGAHQLKVVMDSDLFNLNYISIQPSTLTGLQNDASSSSVIYPNPASDRLYYSSNNNDTFQNIKVYSMSGSLLIDVINPSSNSFDITSLKKGVYIIELSTENQTVIDRFVKE